MQQDVYQSMFEVEDRHWWYTAKQQIVLHLLRRYLTPAPDGARRRIVDLGCGCGAMLARLEVEFDAVGVDGSLQAIKFCERRGVKAELGQLLGEDLKLPREHFDAVLLLDVLEHLPDDVAAVRSAAGVLKPGGIIISTVPAFQWLWSYWDELHHHYRRYSRDRVTTLYASDPRLKLEMVSYANTTLFPIAATVRLFHRFTCSTNGHSEAASAIRVPAAPVNWALRTIYASERHLLGRIPSPFGLSVIAVARKG
jgi:SAM-dependent methyltransferase